MGEMARACGSSSTTIYSILPVSQCFRLQSGYRLKPDPVLDYPFRNDEEQRCLLSRPGGSPVEELSRASIDIDELVNNLMPYRCGVVARNEGSGCPDRIFTEQDVAHHIFSETSIYIIIQDMVYNVTGTYITFTVNERLAVR